MACRFQRIRRRAPSANRCVESVSNLRGHRGLGILIGSLIRFGLYQGILLWRDSTSNAIGHSVVDPVSHSTLGTISIPEKLAPQFS